MPTSCFECVRHTPGLGACSSTELVCDGAMFLHQMGALPEDVGIVCWDARGHGSSTLSGPFVYADMVDDLAAVLDEVCGGRAFLIGQSMGGNLAQTLAARSPDRVERLVLIDCADNHASLSLLDRLGLALSAPIIKVTPWRTMIRLASEACAVRSPNVAYTARCMRKMGRRRFAEVMAFGQEALTPDPDAMLPVSTLAILGEHDRTGRVASQLHALAERDTHVTLQVFAAAGHLANMDNPEACSAAISDFLREDNVLS